MKPLVTIIIPVYQAEKYLRECIDSIRAQEWTNWELLLVDDGSTDQSGKICDEYAELDRRIRVFHQINGGVSKARNGGLNEAYGEYILFVDADDWIEKETLKILISTIQKSGVPMLQFGVKSFADPAEVILEGKKESAVHIYKSLDEYERDHCFQYGVWGYFIKRDYCIHERFTSGVRYAEDIEFITKCLVRAGSLGVLPLNLYHLRLHGASAMAQLNSYDKLADHLTVAWNLLTFAEMQNEKMRFFVHIRVVQIIKSYFSFFLRHQLPDEIWRQVNSDFKSIYPFLSIAQIKERFLFWLAYRDVRIYITLLKFFVSGSLNFKKRSL